ncbi:GAP family protein [Allosaccharopolyspora coralli]|uniref:GAP family protein n=1 Tax=Allosaccharopolyspora coralli TaxID=2665642 RepID=A0A5Q3QJU7_9PSEU|nr:GAP family protein [Allosaccharopolyspora coralli]QGK71815.1 GAP family protein [Allosaccharopolyspora coralli]
MSSLLGFYGLSLLDALNPSALAVTLLLVLRGGPYRSRVVAYVSAIFATYLVLGIAIYAGFGGVLALFDNAIVREVGYWLAAVLGTAMLLFALFPPARTRQGMKLPRLPERLPLSLVMGTGVTITVAEFSTAFPYLGAIGLLRDLTGEFAVAVPLLASYNAIFVLPPVLLMVAFAAFGDRIRPRFQAWLARRENTKDGTWLWILGIVGFLLARHGFTHIAVQLGWLR